MLKWINWWFGTIWKYWPKLPPNQWVPLIGKLFFLFTSSWKFSHVFVCFIGINSQINPLKGESEFNDLLINDQLMTGCNLILFFLWSSVTGHSVNIGLRKKEVFIISKHTLNPCRQDIYIYQDITTFLHPLLKN